MDYNIIDVERNGRVAIVRFDRGSGVNALSLELMKELVSVALALDEDDEISVVVLAGSKECFTGGIDLRDPELLNAMSADIGVRRRLLSYGPKMCAAWESMGPVTIAAIEGHCVGGGVAFAVSCDFRIAGQSAFFRIPELNLGMNMSWQSLPRLTHLVGPARAKQMVILAERVSANQAMEWGLVQEVAEDGKVLKAAMEMAEKIANMPPLPVKMTKKTINALTTVNDSLCSHMDTDQFILCQFTEDHKEGVNAFLTKRSPKFKGK